MARNKAIEERVKTLVAEMLAEEEAEGQLDNINDIEDAMVRIGDLVAREFGVQAWPLIPVRCRRIPTVLNAGRRGSTWVSDSAS